LPLRFSVARPVAGIALRFCRQRNARCLSCIEQKCGNPECSPFACNGCGARRVQTFIRGAMTSADATATFESILEKHIWEFGKDTGLVSHSMATAFDRSGNRIVNLLLPRCCAPGSSC